MSTYSYIMCLSKFQTLSWLLRKQRGPCAKPSLHDGGRREVQTTPTQVAVLQQRLLQMWTSCLGRAEGDFPGMGGRGLQELGKQRGGAGCMQQQRSVRLEGPYVQATESTHVLHFHSSCIFYFYVLYACPELNCSNDLDLNQL